MAWTRRAVVCGGTLAAGEHMSIHIPIHMSIRMPIHMPIHMSVRMSIESHCTHVYTTCIHMFTCMWWNADCSGVKNSVTLLELLIGSAKLAFLVPVLLCHIYPLTKLLNVSYVCTSIHVARMLHSLCTHAACMLNVCCT